RAAENRAPRQGYRRAIHPGDSEVTGARELAILEPGIALNVDAVPFRDDIVDISQQLNRGWQGFLELAPIKWTRG
ncbi:MAG: hypothetical protein ABI718_18640, partial [Acidobacteriota bacterium]